MSQETRVNLLHLLEDIRDSYATQLEEVIVTELIANALDSGASRIELNADRDNGFVRVIDNGRGMKRSELKEYHNIAATAKVRGRGIGFAGIGAKLSLLLAECVITETKGPHGTRSASKWYLSGQLRAPWKYVPFAGNVSSPKGTAVTIFLRNKNSSLLDSRFIVRVIQKHFRPFFHVALSEKLRRFIYRRSIEFLVNDQKAEVVQTTPADTLKEFEIFLGRKNRRPVGFGYIARVSAPSDIPDGLRGLAISTFGKVIKTGWEWTGITPRSYETIYGTVEIPGLAEILTTNKADFLNDTASLRKYYRYRKAVQESIHPILREWGEERMQSISESGVVKIMEQKIEEVLGSLIPEFPELAPLVRIGHRPGYGKKEIIKEREEYLAGVNSSEEVKDQEVPTPREKSEKADRDLSGDGSKTGRKKSPGLQIGFEEEDSVVLLARLAEDTLWINTSHPAWKKAQSEGFENYHIVSATAWALSGFLEESRSAQAFVAHFLARWGEEKEPPRLFS